MDQISAEKFGLDVQYKQPTWLPPGFRFHPTDEELVTYYLARKVADERFMDAAITEVDLNKHEPWELPGKAQMGEKEWYFYNLKDKKYPSGSRINRATQAGYWKATGKDKEVFMKSKASFHGPRKQLVGMKKTLVFYTGRAPRGSKSNWVMHEYRIDDHESIASIHGNNGIKSQGRFKAEDQWVVCRVFHKKLRQSDGRDGMQVCRDGAMHDDESMEGRLQRPLITDAQLLATAARVLLGDHDQQAHQQAQAAMADSAAPPPADYVDTDKLAAVASGCRSSVDEMADHSASSIHTEKESSLLAPIHSCASSDGRVPASALSLPRFPSELECLWVHAAAFLA